MKKANTLVAVYYLSIIEFVLFCVLLLLFFVISVLSYSSLTMEFVKILGLPFIYFGAKILFSRKAMKKEGFKFAVILFSLCLVNIIYILTSFLFILPDNLDEVFDSSIFILFSSVIQLGLTIFALINYNNLRSSDEPDIPEGKQLKE